MLITENTVSPSSKYELKITGGKSGGGNPVEQAKIAGMSGQMYLQAEKTKMVY